MERELPPAAEVGVKEYAGGIGYRPGHFPPQREDGEQPITLPLNSDSPNGDRRHWLSPGVSDEGALLAFWRDVTARISDEP